MSRYKHWRWYVLVLVWIPVMAPLAAVAVTIGLLGGALVCIAEMIEDGFNRWLDKYFQRMRTWEFRNRKEQR